MLQNTKFYFLFFIKILSVFSLIFLQVACKKSGLTGSEVVFNEIENGVPGQVTRMLVTKKFLRIDNGKPDNDFLLFDRKNRVIYSTNSLDQRTLVINAQDLNRQSPVKLENKIEEIPTDAPSIEGNEVKHFQLNTNNQICYDLFAARGLLPEVVTALKEYRQALAGEQAVLLDAMPKEMLQPCDLANNIFYASRHLEHGFPVRLHETSGRFRELVEYRQDIKIEAALLKLPEGYTKFTAEEMRSK